MKTQSGNALFLILIAIFLLGGLTVLLTRQSGTTEETGATEQDSIRASEIMRIAANMEGGVQRLITNGCGENEISFWADSDGNGTENASDSYYNSNSPTDRSCHVFYPEGAGLNKEFMKSAWLDSAYSSSGGYGQYYASAFTVIIRVGSDSATEMTLAIPYITQGVCTAINRGAGINVIPVDHSFIDPAAAPYEARKFNGSYATLNALGDDAGYSNNSLIHGKKSLCIQTATASPAVNAYVFYQTLIAR